MPTPRKKASSRGQATKSGAPAAKNKPTAKKSPARKSPGKTTDVAERAGEIVQRLNQDFPDADCALQYKSPFQLLVATILSAQCTDQRVNIVTKDLFRKYKKPADFANAPLEEIEQAIKSTGFFRSKAKNIQACSQELVKSHRGEVPQDLHALVNLAGVGRKTANVVLGTAFGIASGVVVDTHVSRLSQRMGLTKQKDAVKIEQDLMQLVPQEEWIGFSHRMILHGRKTCGARKPLCEQCSLESVCPKIGVKVD